MLVRASDLGIGFGGVELLKGFNLEVGECQLLLLSGDNGVGKSCLLQTLAGLIPQTSGEIRRFGNASLIGAEFGLFENLKVSRAWQLLARRFGPPSETARTAQSWLQERGLSHRRARDMSGGERNVYALGLAALTRADIYYLDEPFAGMDAQSTQVVADLVTSLLRDRRAVVLADHVGVMATPHLRLRLFFGEAGERRFVLEL